MTSRETAMGPISRWILTTPAFRTLNFGPFSAAHVPGYAVAAALFGLAFFIRHALDAQLPAGFPFLTFFPAIIVTTFLFGLWPGVLCATLCGLASWFVFLPGGPSSILAIAFFGLITVIDIGLIHAMHVALARLDRLQKATDRIAADRAIFVTELDHRIKNIFASVSAVVSLASRHASDPKQLASNVRDRINALSRITALLQGADVRRQSTIADVVDLVLAPLRNDNNIVAHRESLGIPISASVATSLSLIFHELGTNALKHGALSTPTGIVTISGQRTTDVGSTITWVENGGPPPKVASNSGFGSILLSKVPAALGGALTLDFRPSGLFAELRLPKIAVEDRSTEQAY